MLSRAAAALVFSGVGLAFGDYFYLKRLEVTFGTTPTLTAFHRMKTDAAVI